jgi:hypothetical protein
VSVSVSCKVVYLFARYKRIVYTYVFKSVECSHITSLSRNPYNNFEVSSHVEEPEEVTMTFVCKGHMLSINGSIHLSTGGSIVVCFSSDRPLYFRHAVM